MNSIRTGFMPRPEEAAERRAATLRSVYDRTFYAAMAGCCADSNSSNPQIDAHAVALESMRTHAARMAELERVIAEGME